MRHLKKALAIGAVIMTTFATPAHAVSDFDLAGRYGQQLERSMEKCGNDAKCRKVTYSRYGLLAAYEDSARAWENYDRALYRVAKTTCDHSTGWMDLYSKVYNFRKLRSKHKTAKRKTKGLYKSANKALRYAKKKGHISRSSYRKIQSVRDKSYNIYKKTRKQRAMFGLIVSAPGSATKNIRGCRGY